jgi:hypothetical protein
MSKRESLCRPPGRQRPCLVFGKRLSIHMFESRFVGFPLSIMRTDLFHMSQTSERQVDIEALTDQPRSEAGFSVRAFTVKGFQVATGRQSPCGLNLRLNVRSTTVRELLIATLGIEA